MMAITSGNIRKDCHTIKVKASTPDPQDSFLDERDSA